MPRIVAAKIILSAIKLLTSTILVTGGWNTEYRLTSANPTKTSLVSLADSVSDLDPPKPSSRPPTMPLWPSLQLWRKTLTTGGVRWSSIKTMLLLFTKYLWFPTLRQRRTVNNELALWTINLIVKIFKLGKQLGQVITNVNQSLQLSRNKINAEK